MGTATASRMAKDAESSPEQLSSLLGQGEIVDRLLAKHPKAPPELLETLSRSTDKTTRKYVAVNPNASKEVLLRLAPQFPGDFFKNPAFDWLLLEDPDLLTDLGHGVLTRILKRPDCPESFMTWAAERGSEQEKLALAMNPRAPEGALLRLAAQGGKPGEAARAHLKVQGVGDQVDLDIEFENVVKASLEELDTSQARFAWKRGTIGPAHWPWLSLRVRLEVLGRWKNQGLVEGCSPRHSRELGRRPDWGVSGRWRVA